MLFFLALPGGLVIYWSGHWAKTDVIGVYTSSRIGRVSYLGNSTRLAQLCFSIKFLKRRLALYLLTLKLFFIEVISTIAGLAFSEGLVIKLITGCYTRTTIHFIFYSDSISLAALTASCSNIKDFSLIAVNTFLSSKVINASVRAIKANLFCKSDKWSINRTVS
jgi:hypothetical protein